MIELKKDAYGAAADRSGAATFPQAKTTPLLDNERVTVSDYTAPPAARHHHVHDTVIVWVDGSTPHAIFVPRGTVHDTDQTGTTTRATVFELK
jgi:hypothetical protein